MNGLKRLIQSEPAVIIGVVNALLALVVLFGIPITEQQSAGIIVFVNVLLGFATRLMVTPVAKVDAKIDAAVETALTEESMTAAAPAMTAEQQQLVDDLRATIDMLRAERLKA